MVVMKFKGSEIVHEHIYWDQASLLAKIGPIDSKSLPVTGIERARALLKIIKIKQEKIQIKVWLQCYIKSIFLP